MNLVNLAVSEQKKTLEIPYGSQRKYKRELLSLTKDQGGKKILKKHIENARFFKVLEETELCDIDYPKEMQANACKARQKVVKNIYVHNLVYPSY